MSKRAKRAFAVAMALSMTMSALPVTAMAAEPVTTMATEPAATMATEPVTVPATVIITDLNSAKTGLQNIEGITVEGSDSNITVTLSGDILLDNVEIILEGNNITLTIKGDENAIHTIKCTGNGAIGTWNEKGLISSTIVLGKNLNVEQDTSGAVNPVYAYHGGKVTVDGATISSESSKVTPLTAGKNSAVEINSGSVTSSAQTAVSANGGTIDITGGTVQTTVDNPAYVAAWAHGGGKITVKNEGHLIGKTGVALCSTTNGTVEVMGGTITGGTKGAVLAHEHSTAKATISGGEITGLVDAKDSATLTITGGTFDEEFDQSILPEDKTFFENTEGKYMVVDKSKVFNVTFHYNNGTPDDATSAYEKVNEPETPTKEGFTFGGWFSNEALTDQYDFNSEITGDINLYAKWEAVQYKVTFELNGGSPTDELPSQVQVQHGQNITKPADPTREGYTFKGWYLGEEEYLFSTPVTQAIELTAKWEIKKYTVTYVLGGGSLSNQIDEIEYSQTLSNLAQPTRNGYIFDGWYTDANYGTKFDLSTAVKENITLYAKWIENSSTPDPEEEEFTVTFNSDGGSSVDAQTIKDGEKATEPTAPTKTGHTFLYWVTEDGVEFNFETETITENITLTAKWKAETYTVSFNANGGSGTMSPADYSYGAIYNLPECPFSAPDGKEFKGWKVNNGETVHLEGAAITITGSTTITAVWADKEVPSVPDVNVYTVSFDTDVFKVNIDPQKVEAGKTASEPKETLTNSLYKFLYWALNGEKFTFDTPITADITLKAVWEENKSEEPKPEEPKPEEPKPEEPKPEEPKPEEPKPEEPKPEEPKPEEPKPEEPKPNPPAPDYGDDDDNDGPSYRPGGSGSSGGGIGGSSTTTEKNPDGSTTTTTKNNNGTVVENTKYPDGSSVQVKTDKDGTVTTTEKDAKGNKTETVEKSDGSKEFTSNQKDGSKATASVDKDGTVTANVDMSKKAIEEAAKQGQPVTLPIPEFSTNKDSAPSTIDVDLPNNAGKTDIVIPMDEMTPGTVVILVLPDGTEEVITQTKATEDGLAVTLTGDATLKVVDNSKDFDDVNPSDWFSDATDFVSSRNLFAGTSETEFSPDAPMTMEMLFAVAHNFMGKPETTASGVAGANPEDWFHTASNWAAEMGLTNGLNMDMLGTNQPISREDTAILLFNLSGKSAEYTPSADALAKLNAFSDIADMDPAKLTALAWAVENGIMNGMGDGSFGFKGNNTRAQTGAVMMNFNQNC